MKLPNEIKPCPILEATFEMRFKANIPDDAIFGFVYKAFIDRYKNQGALPVLQIPLQVRTSDPNLLYAPHYRMVCKNFVIQFGPRVFGLTNVKPYVKWDAFLIEIENCYKKMVDLGIIANIERTAVKYVNFFNGLNILEKLTLKISLDNDEIADSNINFSTNIKCDKGERILKIVAPVEIQEQVQAKVNKSTGSILEVDSVFDISKFDTFKEAIVYAHDKEKSLFFKLLTEEYRKSITVS
ncbi:MAG: hypothetical protein COB02_09060 [Candidatus Cloacimonadota bacterium]|nr:MAG: hypothetical protein COB02_09060 [Candidatus Cloacimonadota bacterium]